MKNMNNQFPRRKTRQLKVRDVLVGGDAPVSIQSMCTTNTFEIEETLAQIRSLAVAGCEIVRVAVPTHKDADALSEIVRESLIPVIADIHFDWRLALRAIEAGVDGLRLNPGNIGKKERVQEVVAAARERRLPIRIGVNAGSLEKEFAERYPDDTPLAMVESGLSHVRILEDLGYDQIKISLKASDVPTMLAAYRLMATKSDYPLHLGVTEAGPPGTGSVKSSIGIGTLLAEGIGDTIRVSLTADPVKEVELGKQILRALGLRKDGLNLISCPTCGRIATKNFEEWVQKVERELDALNLPLTVAVMGCVVNGPGESAHADIGVSFGGVGPDGEPVGILVKNGEVYKKLPESQLIPALIEEAKNLGKERNLIPA
ncbi:MAG: flavodoxin-dependent (E)-4-hydroxy-3-methylbut-2-enyl-diphosphate synthase [Candidatus Caenarcaniphilales bacterium]|nr:flavodoxin-dependent (E)-4-hydroxy-3-methylbut-2-enyl-diphosphate synthase [Candidatus Caenarcaniphilales bacterium]